VLGLALALVVLGRGPATGETKDPCEDLADVFHRLAVDRERGASKKSQLAWVRKTYGGPDESAQARSFVYALDYVYGSPADAAQIRETVRAACTVNERGSAVLRLE
jgi:hypothetical protein